MHREMKYHVLVCPRRKKMFYLTTHLTHFIYDGYMIKDHGEKPVDANTDANNRIYSLKNKSGYGRI